MQSLQVKDLCLFTGYLNFGFLLGLSMELKKLYVEYYVLKSLWAESKKSLGRLLSEEATEIRAFGRIPEVLERPTLNTLL